MLLTFSNVKKKKSIKLEFCEKKRSLKKFRENLTKLVVWLYILRLILILAKFEVMNGIKMNWKYFEDE